MNKLLEEFIVDFIKHNKITDPPATKKKFNIKFFNLRR